MKRRERKELARKNKTAFEPQYNRPVTREEFKSNNKYHFLNQDNH